jgi:hypothetical protein
MTIIAVQTAIGGSGSMATTVLDLSFGDMLNIGSFQYGANDVGLYILNQGDKDADVVYERSFTLAATDFGIRNPKKLRYIYVGYEADGPFTVSVKADESDWKPHTVSIKKGLGRVRIPIGHSVQGRYWSVKISSTTRFRIDKIDGIFIVRSSGIKGY